MALRLGFPQRLSAILVFGFALGISVPAHAVGFQPVSQEELKMTVEPKAPGAPAIVLFREVDRDDRGNYSDYYPVYLKWMWNWLPAGTAAPVEAPDHIVYLEASDIAAFQTEDYMPPEDELKSRVDFVYSEDRFENDPAKYWKKFDKKRNQVLESFIDKRKPMEEAVAGIVSPRDSPEEKLRKIYARVQQVRNTDFEAEKTEQEQKRNKEKPAENVEVVWKQQHASGFQLTRLFLALVRAAGVEAYGMLVPSRRNFFFDPGTMDSRRLNANVVTVKVNGKDLFFDPGAQFTPFGMLPWFETGVEGLKLDKDGGNWLQTNLPAAAESQILRKANLKLSDTGDIEGKVTYTGLEASLRRVDQVLEDDAARKKFLEDEIREAIPAACEVELTSQPDWKASSPLVAEYTLKVPGWVAGAGRRALMPVGLFGAPEKHLFDHTDRVHPIYFEFPFQRSDDISVASLGLADLKRAPGANGGCQSRGVYTRCKKRQKHHAHQSSGHRRYSPVEEPELRRLAPSFPESENRR